MMALIAGTGLESLFPHARQLGATGTPWGIPSSPLHLHETEQGSLLLLNRHGDAGELPPHKLNYRANIAALRDAGAEQVISINTVGAISCAHAVGGVCLPHQVLDFTWGRASSFYEGGESGRKHIDFTFPFDEELRRQLLRAAADAFGEAAAVVDGGVYVCMQGPRLETAAEIDYLARIGADIVGMTLMPEAALAREAGLKYAPVCPLVNAAAGLSGEQLSIEQIEATLKNMTPLLKQVVLAMMEI